ncbi:hypothetical protein AWR27_10550 [Spirosoma montaniterrae]|uniref:Uncharacterized protein n=2 Tax=Spirosoma montaniterrae TaxID=1178516 RepID=A0A1P9WWN5_9BACT|nr:hypothetical protein AWR27_10550 [Spirosoma montaniterrae]
MQTLNINPLILNELILSGFAYNDLLGARLCRASKFSIRATREPPQQAVWGSLGGFCRHQKRPGLPLCSKKAGKSLNQFMMRNHTNTIKSIIITIGFIVVLLKPKVAIAQCRNFTLKELEKFSTIDPNIDAVFREAGYKLVTTSKKNMVGWCGKDEGSMGIIVPLVGNPKVALMNVSHSYLDELSTQMAERNYRRLGGSSGVYFYANDRFKISELIISKEKKLYRISIQYNLSTAQPDSKNSFYTFIAGFREYVEVSNQIIKNDLSSVYSSYSAKIPNKVDELSESDFYTIATNVLGSVWFDNLYDIKLLIKKGVNPTTGKEELTDRAKLAIIALNEIRPRGISIVRFVQMIQEIADQTASVRAKFREERLKEDGNKAEGN